MADALLMAMTCVLRNYMRQIQKGFASIYPDRTGAEGYFTSNSS